MCQQLVKYLFLLLKMLRVSVWGAGDTSSLPGEPCKYPYNNSTDHVHELTCHPEMRSLVIADNGVHSVLSCP